MANTTTTTTTTRRATSNNELNDRTFNRLQTIHWVFCGILVVLTLSIVVFNKLVATNTITRDNSLLFIALATTVLFPIISNYVYNRRIQEIDLDESVKFRFDKFSTASMLRYSWLAGAGVLNVGIWFLSALLLIAVLNAFLLVFIILIRPVKFDVIKLLRMKPSSKPQ